MTQLYSIMKISYNFSYKKVCIYSNIIEKRKENDKKVCSSIYSKEQDPENVSKSIYNQTVFIKHLLDHYNENPDSEAACIGKNVLKPVTF